MKHLVLLVALLSTKVVLADALVANNKQTRTIDCAKDGVVVIAGNDNTIRLKGKCKLVSLPGNGNKVTAEASIAVAVDGNSNQVTINATDAISANGNKNTVTWSTTLDGDGEPDISSWGDDNTIKKK